MDNSCFFKTAKELINIETRKIESFCDTLDKDPIAKKKQITEYIRAKHRYAGVSNVCAIFSLNHRVAESNTKTHYLIPQLNDIFAATPEYLALYDDAPDSEKRDYALYYGTIAFVDSEIAKHESRILNSTDWEKVELEERIGGLRFAKECLSEAWDKRKEVIV
ncbi:MAG: hypothetical protein IJ404_06560 [Clostridia bacterium]|nr:hypothetical protein [Clostridia bacterium]